MLDIESTRIPAGSVGVWWLGQGGFVFKTASGKVIVVDPYLSNSCGEPRLTPILIEPAGLAADLLFCTHAHDDHADKLTIKFIKNINRFAGPSSVCEVYRSCGVDEKKIDKIERGESRSYGTVTVNALYARHTGDSTGVVLGLEGVTAYVSGDTEYDEKLADAGRFKPDLMFICINGKWGNMNAGEAARLTEKIGPKLVIPMHYGMFAVNTVDPNLFIGQLQATKYAGVVKVLEAGKAFVYTAA